MPRVSPVRIGLLTGTTAAAVLCMSLPALAADTPPAAGTVLEEVVVTAAKRSERLQDVPLAVSAVSGDALERANVSSFTDYARSIPGLAFSDLGDGRQKPSIRGISVNTGAAAVGYYIDETPLPATGGTLRLTDIDPGLYDLDRVEVLRGPQGTLYGSGSMGGTIKLVPRRPNLTGFEGSLKATGDDVAHGGVGGELDGMVNIPLVQDKLAVRAVAWGKAEDGFIDRQVNGHTVDNVPTDNTLGFRVAAEFRPVDELRFNASVFHENQRFNGFQSVTFGPANPNNDLVQNFLFDTPEPNRNVFTLYNLTAEASLKDVTLLSSTSYYRGLYSAVEETGQLLAEFVGPTFDSAIPETNSLNSFSQEVRLASAHPFGRFDWIVGAFYSRTTGHRLVDYEVPEYIPIVGSSMLFFSEGHSKQTQKAAFGELSFHLTDKLTLTGGLRYYDVKGDDSVHADGLFNGGLTIIPSQPSGANGLVKKLNLSWKPQPGLLFYAQAAQGFRPGFGRAPILSICLADAIARGIDPSVNEVRPDTVWNYEAGAKTTLAGGRVTLNAALFRIKWTDIQLGVLLPCGFQIPSNAGDATSQGAEFETAVQLSDHIQVGGSLSYTDATFDRVEPGALAKPGDPLLEVPKWQASGYGEYRFAGPVGTEGLARVEVQYTGDSLLFYDRNPATAPAPLGFRERPALTLVNARLELSRDDWSVAVFGKNLTDDVQVVGFADLLAANLSDRPRFTVNRPRTIGVELSRRF